MYELQSVDGKYICCKYMCLDAGSELVLFCVPRSQRNDYVEGGRQCRVRPRCEARFAIYLCFKQIEQVKLRSAVSKTNIKIRLLAGISFLKKKRKIKKDATIVPDLRSRLNRWMATLTGVHFSLNACAWCSGCVLCSMRQRTSTAAQIAMGEVYPPP